ncbi:MAG: polysaccharide deacetylase family protein [Pseudomonadota bacterium]
MPSFPGFLTRLRLELAGLRLVAPLIEASTRPAGAILRFARVRPARPGAFQPLKRDEVTPEFLDGVLRALRRWHYDIIPIGEVVSRAEAGGGRFVCLTFDGGSRDLIEYAAPVLKRHMAPFTLYLPTGFLDGVGEAWWLALEQVVATHSRISLVINGEERRFKLGSTSEKHDVYDYLGNWLRGLPPAERTNAIGDLCKRHGADLASASRAFAMTWDDVAGLAADPLVTIGTATVHWPALSSLSPAEAAREIRMGRAVAEAATGRSLPHFAYPSDAAGYGRREIGLAAEAGLATAATTNPGVIMQSARPDPLALPRVTIDGRMPSLRVLRAQLAGAKA